MSRQPMAKTRFFRTLEPIAGGASGLAKDQSTGRSEMVDNPFRDASIGVGKLVSATWHNGAWRITVAED